MARIRTVKPDLFKHEALFDAEAESGLPLRLAFIGLFTVCDKAGRFAWRPRALKTDVLPYDAVDFSRVLDALLTRGFVIKYRVGNDEYGAIPSWSKHQFINNRESNSEIPEPIEEQNENDASSTREPRVSNASEQLPRGKGREGEEERKSSEANASGASLPSVVVPINAKAALWGDGLALLSEISGRPPDRLKSQIGKWCKLSGDDHAAIHGVIRRARDEGVIDPVAWIEAALKPRDPDEQIYRGVL